MLGHSKIFKFRNYLNVFGANFASKTGNFSLNAAFNIKILVNTFKI